MIEGQIFECSLFHRAEAKENGTLDAHKDKNESSNDEDATSKLTSRKRLRPSDEEAENSSTTPPSYDLNDLKTYGASVFPVYQTISLGIQVFFADLPDILICGNCKDIFTNLNDIIEHKKFYCKLRFACKCGPHPTKPFDNPMGASQTTKGK